MTIVVSRYMYLCSALILNYAFISLNGSYQIVSFIFAIFFTILLLLIIIAAFFLAFYHGDSYKKKLRLIRPMFMILRVLFQNYRSKTFVARFLSFWMLLSNVLTVLILELLQKWQFVQLGLLMALNVITMGLSIPHNIYISTVQKWCVILTELGFVVFSLIVLAMFLLQNSGGSSSYTARLRWSWTAIAINICILLLQIISGVIEYVIKRRKEKAAKKQLQTMRKFMISRQPRRIRLP
jgi:hypothetical protein